LKTLIGITEHDLETVLQREAGFLFVLRVQSKIEKIPTLHYLAPLSNDQNGVFSPLLDVESDGQKTISAKISPLLIAVQLANEDNWFTYWPFIGYYREGSSEYYYPPSRSKEIDLVDWGEPEPNRVVVAPRQALHYATMDELRQKSTESYQEMLSFAGSSRSADGCCHSKPCAGVLLFNQSSTFAAESLIVGDLASLPSELRAATVELFDSVVKGDVGRAKHLVTEDISLDDLGLLAATSLEPTFNLSFIPTSNTTGPAARATLIGAFHYFEGADAQVVVSLEMSLEKRNKAWQLSKVRRTEVRGRRQPS